MDDLYPDISVNWYAARVKYRTEKKIKTFLDDAKIECYIPFHDVMHEINGKRFKREKPVIPCVVFVRTQYQKALSLPIDCGFGMTYIKNTDTQKLQTIPDKQMKDFMFVLDLSDSTIRLENSKLRRGDRVRVIKGELTGVEGELVRIRGHKRVVIRLEGLFSLVTAYIPCGYLEKI
jgi:transcription antitermination factor NusG